MTQICGAGVLTSCFTFKDILSAKNGVLGLGGGGVKVSQQVKNSQLGELSFFTVQIH